MRKGNATKVSDQKMDQILSTVRTILAKNGLAATTISQIAGQAGVSRGLLHYYFKNKDEMVHRVIQTNMKSILHLITSIFRRVNSPEELAVELIQALRQVLENDPDFFTLLLESWAVSRGGAGTSDELKQHHREFRSVIHRGLKELSDRGVISPVVPLDGLAILLTAIVDGLGMQLVIDPRLIKNRSIWVTSTQAVRLLVA
jgi:AcrR family transcriptional regulator